MNRFGASAPYSKLFPYFGFTVENVVARVKALDVYKRQELTKEQPEESEQADLKEKQLDELDAASTEESQEGSMELSMEPSMESSMEVEAKPEDRCV